MNAPAPRSPAGAVVTGAGRGLGRRLAGLLAERGHRVLVTDVDGDAAKVAAAEIGSGAEAFTLDVTSESQVLAARDRIVEWAGRLDIWVNNAGVMFTGPVWELDEACRRLTLEVNAIGTMNGTLAAIEAMRGSGGGHIVNIASLAGISAVPGEGVYAGSKHAVIGFSMSALADLRAAKVSDIDISCVCPDGIWTPMLHDRLDDPGAALSFSGKLLQPEEVVEAVSLVIDRPRPVMTVPGWRGALCRFGAVFPRVGVATMPLMSAQGRRVQKKMLAQR